MLSHAFVTDVNISKADRPAERSINDVDLPSCMAQGRALAI